jgi:hypothetical protein
MVELQIPQLCFMVWCTLSTFRNFMLLSSTRAFGDKLPTLVTVDTKLGGSRPRYHTTNIRFT